jgi:predicted component of type VI protein secretion system
MQHRLTLLVENGLSAGVSLPIGHDSVTLIGRAPDAALRLHPDEKTVSREHCVLDVAAGSATVKNLQKPTRTLVNNKPVEGVARMEPGDRLTIGRVVLRLVAVPIEPPAEIVATQNLTLADIE